MAAPLETAIKFTTKFEGQGLDALKRNLQSLSQQSQTSSRFLDQLYTETQKLSNSAGNSSNALKAQKLALEALRGALDPTGRRFALLSQDIADVTAKLKQAESTAAAFALAGALKTAAAGASAGMVSFAGLTASSAAVSNALQRMGVSGDQAEQMLRGLQGQMESVAQSTQKLGSVINQALASTPQKAAQQINVMRQALAQQKIGSDEYLATLVRINEAEAVMQARSGRASVIAGARTYQGATMTRGYGSEERLPGLPNTMAADMQRVSEITARIQNLDRSTDQYRQSLQELEVVQRRLNIQPRQGLDFRGAMGSAAGAVVMGGGPGAALGALGGSLAAGGGPIGLAAAGGLAATAGLAMQSVGNARALEEQTRRLRVMTTEGDALQKQIVALSREQGHLTSTTEATAAAYDILQAGFSNSSEILNILKASTLGAVGGFTDVKTVADATTSILNGYGLSASEAGRIVDQMKASTDDGKISMEAYAQSIGRVVPSAAAAKVPLEEINAAISSLTAQGVPVETTFSGINQAIKTILKPTQEARELAKALGLEFNAQALAAKGLGGFLADVSAKTGKSSDALSILFSDIDGYKAVIGLLNDDLQRFNQFTDNQANAIGRSAAAAEKAIDPLKRFDNAWKDLTSTLGQLVLPSINNIVDGITKVLQGLINMPQWLKEVGKWATILTNQLTPLGSLLNGLAWIGGNRNNQSASSATSPAVPQIPAMPRAGNSTPAQAATAARATAVASSLLDGGSSSAAGAGRGSGLTGGASSFRPSSQTQALLQASRTLGVNPLDLATIIGFETGGTYNPSQWGGAGGNYMGLIQFGGPERRQYGAYQGQSFEEQVTGPVVRFFQDRFKGQNMSTQGADLLTLYRTVLGGNPKANINGQDAFGTSPASGVSMMGGHRAEALRRFFGGNMANVGYSGADAASDSNAAYEFQQDQERQMAKQFLAAKENYFLKQSELKVAEAQTEEERLRAEYDLDRSKRMKEFISLQTEAMSVQEAEAIAATQRLEIQQAEYEYALKITDLQERQLAAITEMGDAMGTRAFSTPDIQAPGSEFKPFAGYVEGIGTMNDALNNLATTGFKGIEDAMVSLATTGKANFREFAVAMLEDTARIIIQQMVLKTILSAIGGIGGGGSNFSGIPGFNPATGSLAGDGFSGFNPGAFTMPALSSGFAFAKGGAFSRNGIVPFARGGIVNNPTLFRFANGGSFATGMMGEAGPEAIIPLKRGRDGRLGVSGGGDVSVSVQVNAGGTPAENDGSKARELGQVVAQAVKAEIVRQKRPGGILS